MKVINLKVKKKKKSSNMLFETFINNNKDFHNFCSLPKRETESICVAKVFSTRLNFQITSQVHLTCKICTKMHHRIAT